MRPTQQFVAAKVFNTAPQFNKSTLNECTIARQLEHRNIVRSVGIVLPALLVGVMALALHYGTYVSEAYRAGITSVGQGQRNAAAALGLSPREAFFLIVLPQAIPPIVPALGNYLIALFKETPLLSAIAIVELLQTAKLIGSETFRYNEPITMVGIILLALSLMSAGLVRRVERWANRWR